MDLGHTRQKPLPNRLTTWILSDYATKAAFTYLLINRRQATTLRGAKQPPITSRVTARRRQAILIVRQLHRPSNHRVARLGPLHSFGRGTADARQGPRHIRDAASARLAACRPAATLFCLSARRTAA
ncbi:hypothetical protein BHE74_00010940 [Ensete ventricosum]|nr:hypothetical protein BHE74_00010940 [Ensete ventricosum]